HPLGHGGTVVELSGDPRCTTSGVLVVHHPNPGLQLLVSGLFGRPGVGGVVPGVERRTGDLYDLAQPLHLEGVTVVGNELEAAHQFVSPAKYFAANRKISRSVDNRDLSARSSRFSARSRASSCSGVSTPGAGSVAEARLRCLIATPAALHHAVRVASWMPSSAAIWVIVAPSVSRYSATASRLNSSG